MSWLMLCKILLVILMLMMFMCFGLSCCMSYILRKFKIVLVVLYIKVEIVLLSKVDNINWM